MKKAVIIPTNDLYKWAKNFKRIQDRFYDKQYKLRRLQEIEDFVKLNNFKSVYHIEEVKLDLILPATDNIESADIILVTHQGYSRYPLTGIIEQIEEWLKICPNLYLCLNRHYLNINNEKLECNLPADYLQAITYWLSTALQTKAIVVDLSRDYIDIGESFTWSCPDRHYYIRKLKD